MMMEWKAHDYADLKTAVTLLESPMITAIIANLVGTPIESLLRKRSDGAQDVFHETVKIALHKAANAALWSLANKPNKAASTLLHKVLAAISGAIGGAFGFAALAMELPISTTIMLRSIADIARSEGFDLHDRATKQSCMEVFALGGPGDADDAAKTSYYAVRGFVAETISMLSRQFADIAANQVSGFVFPPGKAIFWLATVMTRIAARFGIVITEKSAAKARPMMGCIAGASLNVMFTDFYQDMARGHFIVKRLKLIYGEEDIQTKYEAIRKAL
ncbi:EcsC family protein [Candidatus Symbiobacter mobilis]|uniref:LasA family protein n=1 Tax=Candidatus Symbiobacter mobilis CR TaxID=946483 RepID=U5N7K5_9BURK|nr:EcsC family protein [Candidatus Symbiobacter mobilis]AGX87516.1 LasA family protein [Candidatus Symbiobacter mobilis CR]